MLIVVQRVKSASVTVEDKIISEISQGYLILLGVAKEDTESDVKFLADKISTFRIFPDGDKKMNLSIQDVSGAALVVSQFTLCGDWRKGRRPGFSTSAPLELAESLYIKFCELLRSKNIEVKTGQFGAMMDVELINDGPVTFVMESRESK